jgi:hypothetical protein
LILIADLQIRASLRKNRNCKIRSLKELAPDSFAKSGFKSTYTENPENKELSSDFRISGFRIVEFKTAFPRMLSGSAAYLYVLLLTTCIYPILLGYQAGGGKPAKLADLYLHQLEAVAREVAVGRA